MKQLQQVNYQGGGCKAITIYDNFDSPKESGTINFPSICQTSNAGIVLFVCRVYDGSWSKARVFSSIPLQILRKSTSTQLFGLSSQGKSRERNFYWNGTGITLSNGDSLGITQIVYLY